MKGPNHLWAAILYMVMLPCGSAFGAADPEDDLESANVLMIWIDALRADHLGCYGYSLPTSPSIDELAETSVLLMNHHTPHTVTIGSFMSMITSLYPAAHGVNHVGKDVLSPAVPTFAEILSAHGYKTAWFGPNDSAHLDPAIGYGRGFDEASYFPRDASSARRLIQGWVRENIDRKFFLNFHTYMVHSPYYPAATYRELFSDGLIPGFSYESEFELELAAAREVRKAIISEGGLAWKILGKELCREIAARGLIPTDDSLDRERLFGYLQSVNKMHKWHALVNDLYQSGMKCDDPRAIEHFVSQYDASIRTVDSEIIGPFMELLAESKLLDETIIIIASDHGEEFCEHGRFGHGTTLYDEVTRVPLIVRMPGIGRKRIDSLTQTVDLLPTVLEFLGIPVPEHAQGVSFLPLLTNDSSPPRRRYVYGQLPFMRAIRSTDHKLIVHRSQSWLETILPFSTTNKELFDLRSDPLEMDSVLRKQRDTAKHLQHNLDQWEAQMPTYQVDSHFPSHIDEDTKERVRKTGYW